MSSLPLPPLLPLNVSLLISLLLTISPSLPHPLPLCLSSTCSPLPSPAADWEEDTVKRGVMLNLMPIPHVFEMNEIIPMSRMTDNSGRRMLTSGPDVRDSQSRSNGISHR